LSRHAQVILQILPEPTVFLRIFRGAYFGLLVRRDVARDAESAYDLPRIIPQRHLGRRNPCHAPIRPGFLFLFSKNWNACFHDALLVLECRAAMLVGKDIEIGFPLHLFGRRKAEPFGTRLVNQDDVPFPIHEIDVVLDVIHQVLHQVWLVRHETLPSFSLNSEAYSIMVDLV